jgi:hypothetical protein
MVTQQRDHDHVPRQTIIMTLTSKPTLRRSPLATLYPSSTISLHSNARCRFSNHFEVLMSRRKASASRKKLL